MQSHSISFGNIQLLREFLKSKSRFSFPTPREMHPPLQVQSQKGSITVVRHNPTKLWERLKFDFRFLYPRKIPGNQFTPPKNSNAKPFDIIRQYPAVTRISEIQMQILVPHTEMHPETTLVAPTLASSVSEGVHYGNPALSDKIMVTSKI
ncbi:hypothetical protein TNCV_3766641 [Trichonephila clavipes]|nr:hypothetical protein TNCV_3766641 [Trichonephila clavipes]